MTAGNGRQLANGLGWFSIGLGLAEVAAPGGGAAHRHAGYGRKARAAAKCCVRVFAAQLLRAHSKRQRKEAPV